MERLADRKVHTDIVRFGNKLYLLPKKTVQQSQVDPQHQRAPHCQQFIE